MKILMFVGITAGGGLLGALLGYFGKCSSGACPLTANPWRGALFGLLIGALAALSIVGSPAAARAAKGKTDSSVLHIKHKDEFKQRVLAENTFALVDFYADWCGPCRRLSPVIESLAETGRQSGLVVAKVNVDRHRDLAGDYQVRSIPHLLLVRDGEVLDTRSGFQSEEELAQWIRAHREID